MFATTTGGESDTLTPLQVLTNALDTPACSACPLAGNIMRAAREHGAVRTFVGYLCQELHPVDAGICCLRQCLNGVPQEHSIQAFCDGKVGDLMDAPLVPTNCVSNAEGGGATTDDGAGSNDDNNTSGGGGGAGSSDGSETGGDNSSGAAAASSVIDESTPATVESSSVESTTPSATSSTSATGTTSPTTPQSTPQATPNVGADARKHVDRLKRLGFAVLPVVIAAL